LPGLVIVAALMFNRFKLLFVHDWSPASKRSALRVAGAAPLFMVMPTPLAAAMVKVLVPPMVTAFVSLMVRLLIVKSAPSVVTWLMSFVLEKTTSTATPGVP